MKRILLRLKNVENIPVIRVFISSGSEKPYYKKQYGLSPKGCFIRVGTSAEPMTQTQIEDMFSHRVRRSLKHIPSPRKDLTFRQLHIYYDSKHLTLNDNFAQNLELLTDDGRFNYVANLLADENSTSIKVAKYAGKDRVDLIGNYEYGYCSLLKASERVLDRLHGCQMEKKPLYKRVYKRVYKTLQKFLPLSRNPSWQWL